MRDFHVPGRSSVLAERGMCATSHPLAAQAAVEILKNEPGFITKSAEDSKPTDKP